ncbi:MAG: hypothetical protein ACOYEH_00935 [Caldicoprobacterales bacterium]|jgi:hypothetical protein
MICPSCGTKNNYYHRYCYYCGSRLVNEEYSEKEQLFPEHESLTPEDESDYSFEGESRKHLFSDHESLIPEDESDYSFEEESREHLFSDHESLIPEEESDYSFEGESGKHPFSDHESLIPEGGLYYSPEGESSDSDNSMTSISYDELSATDIPNMTESEPLSQPYAGFYDDFLSDFSVGQDAESGFDIQTQLPLRRYRKTRKSTNSLQRAIKTFATIVLLVLVGLLLYVGYVEFIQWYADNKSAARSIDMGYRVEETVLDGETARKITILSSLGEQIRVNDKVIPIIGGEAVIILPDSEFDLNEYEQADGFLQVFFPVTVLADGYPSYTEEIYFELPIQTAPLEFLSPANKEAIVDGDVYQLILKVLPGSNVYIDDNNYSHMVDELGHLSVLLDIPEQPETRYEIHVSAKGYADISEQVVFKRRQMEFPLTINQEIPIQASEDVWVEVTGNTHPEAVLSTNLEVRDGITVDADTGDFRLFVKAPAKGYTPFILTAQMEGKEDITLEMVIQRPVNEQEYAQSAWAMNYDDLKAYPGLHNGNSFMLTGKVTEVQSTGTTTTLLVNIAAEGQPEQIVYVDYWGTINTRPGQQLRIFGNRWGNKENCPYIIASYIYR